MSLSVKSPLTFFAGKRNVTPSDTKSRYDISPQPVQTNTVQSHRRINKQIHPVSFHRYILPGILIFKRIRLCSIDPFPVFFQPFPHLLQYILFKRYDTSVSFRTDIEQIIPTAAHHLYQTPDFFICLLSGIPSFLPGTVSPGLLKERSSSLPRHSDLIIRIFIIRHHAKITAIVPQASANHTIGLQGIHQIIKPPALLRRKRAHIEPNFRNFSVFRHNLRHLFPVKSIMFRRQRISIVAGYRISLREMPVDQRKVNAETHPLPTASLGQFFHDIPGKRSRIDNIVISIPAMVHTKTVVVFGSKNNRFHPGFFSQCDNTVGIPMQRYKTICHSRIPISEDSGMCLYLFTIPSGHRLSVPHTSQFGIQPPMNKHGKFLIHPY